MNALYQREALQFILSYISLIDLLSKVNGKLNYNDLYITVHVNVALFETLF